MVFVDAESELCLQGIAVFIMSGVGRGGDGEKFVRQFSAVGCVHGWKVELRVGGVNVGAGFVGSGLWAIVNGFDDFGFDGRNLEPGSLRERGLRE